MALFTVGRKESARSNYGGIQSVILINFQAENYAPVIGDNGQVTSIGASTTDRVTGYKYDLRGQNTFSQPGAGGGSETGTNVVLQNLILQLKTVTAPDNANIENIATNRPHVLVMDYRGGVWLAGCEFGMEIKKYEQVFGTNPEDFVGYNIEAEGKERRFAEFGGIAVNGVIPDALFVDVVEATVTPG